MIIKPGFTYNIRMAKWAKYSRHMSLSTTLLGVELDSRRDIPK